MINRWLEQKRNHTRASYLELETTTVRPRLYSVKHRKERNANWNIVSHMGQLPGVLELFRRMTLPPIFLHLALRGWRYGSGRWLYLK